MRILKSSTHPGSFFYRIKRKTEKISIFLHKNCPRGKKTREIPIKKTSLPRKKKIKFRPEKSRSITKFSPRNYLKLPEETSDCPKKLGKRWARKLTREKTKKSAKEWLLGDFSFTWVKKHCIQGIKTKSKRSLLEGNFREFFYARPRRGKAMTLLKFEDHFQPVKPVFLHNFTTSEGHFCFEIISQ